MRFSANKGNTPLPPAEYRCIWMTAGVLSYQLCDREFDCEECPLDRAMRMHFTKPVAASQASHDEPASSSALFSRNHFLLTSGGGATWRAGIEPGLGGILPPVKSVVLPAAGDRLDEHSPAAWIVFDDGTLPFLSPVSGQVVRANEHLRTHPHLVAVPASPDGWLFEVDPAAGQVSRLAPQQEIRAAYAQDEARFRALLEAAVNRGAAAVGPTLPDGGKRLDSLIAMVGAKKYCELLVQAFSAPGSGKKRPFSDS